MDTRRPTWSLSAAELESYFPYLSSIIRRGSWSFQDYGEFNERMARLGSHRSGTFNEIMRCRFVDADAAETLTEFALQRRLHRLSRNSTHGASREEVGLEWERMEAEREEILGWGRATGMLREVVQQYRFERSIGAYSHNAHEAAAAVIEKAHPMVADPLNYAGVLIEWSEKEHRAWFWRCCREQQHL